MLATQPKIKPCSNGYAPHAVPYADEHDDTLMSKEEFFAEVDAALEEVRQGKGYTMLEGETLTDFLNRIHGCIA
ncbi:MAG: hypothetical protein LBL94_00865 [Prevotellaceae bacterium]|jgi:hypothetical protein|nr:hypothetical protein [Prevotellaceae bacterium]